MGIGASVIPIDWQSRYRAFLALDETKEAIAAADSEAFFARYPRVVNETVSHARLAKPLAECRLGVVTTAGLHLVDQTAFDWQGLFGDCSARLLPTKLQGDSWRISHGHYDEAAARQDLNVVLPVGPLGRLVDEGQIGQLAQTAGSIDGYCTDAGGLLADAGETLWGALGDGQIDALLMVPV